MKNLFLASIFLLTWKEIYMKGEYWPDTIRQEGEFKKPDFYSTHLIKRCALFKTRQKVKEFIGYKNGIPGKIGNQIIDISIKEIKQ